MRRKIAVILLLAATIPAGCNLPSPTGGPAAPGIQTAAAQTVQAVLTPLGSPTAVPTSGPAVTQSSAPILTVDDNTNCRTGPGTNYAKVTTIPAGTSVQVVARYGGGTYWIVNPPNVAENCWISGELGKVTGDTSTLPEVTPEAGADSDAPARPGSLFYNYFCSGGEVTTTLTWEDAANNENGYRVYRFDTVIVDLPPNSTQYVDTVTVAGGTQLQYRVEAYNSAGASPPRTASFSCQ